MGARGLDGLDLGHEGVQVNLAAPAPGALHLHLRREFQRIREVGVHGELDQIGVLALGQGSDLVITMEHVRRSDGLGLECVVDADDLVGAMHLARVRGARDRRLDIEQGNGRAHRSVVVEGQVRPGAHGVTPPHPLGADLRGEHRPVQEIAPVDVLEGTEGNGDSHGDRALELIAATSAAVLDSPAMVGAHEVVVDQRLLVGIENDVEPNIAVDMEGHLPAHGGVLREKGIQLDACVVHHRGAAGTQRDLGLLHRGGVEIRERRCDRAHPGRAVGPELDALLTQHRGVG